MATADLDELERLSLIIEPFILSLDPPVGQKEPPQTTVVIKSFARDPKIRAWIRFNANGVCEGCESSAPFLRENDRPFLEVHHLRPLASGGSDTIANAIALCPNCHRRLHFSKDKKGFLEEIYKRLNTRLVRE